MPTSAVKEESLLFSSETILGSFFRDLLETTTAGYVLYGSKPIDLENYLDFKREIPGTKEHYYSITMQLVKQIWPGVFKKPKKQRYILHFTKNEVLIINRDKFIQAVKDNLQLFQYKFGIGITPEKLLNSFLSEENDFYSLLHESTALQGILLGYGTQNAITYEKGTAFAKSIFTKMHSLPYQSPIYPKSPEELVRKMKLNPRWEQIKNEIQDLSHWDRSTSNHLKIPFSFHKDSTETKRLFREYSESQKIVDSILKAKDFTKLMTLRLGGDPDKFSKIILCAQEKNRLHSIVARSILEAFPEEFSKAFLDGMRAAEKTDTKVVDKGCKTDLVTPYENLKFFDALRRTYSDLNATAQIMEYANKENLTCLIPQRLYFQILKLYRLRKVLLFSL